MEDVLKGTREGLETPSSIPTETLFSSAPAARFATAVMPDRSLLAGYCSLRFRGVLFTFGFSAHCYCSSGYGDIVVPVMDHAH
jgi:hypothetical protein